VHWKMPLQTLLIDDEHAEAWDAFVKEGSSFSLLQSWSWGEVKKKLGWDAYRVAVAEDGVIIAGAQMLVRRLPLGVGSLAYVPCGPLGDWTRAEVARPLFEALHAIARSNRAVFMNVEACVGADRTVQELFMELGFGTSSVAMQPRATIVVDITPEPEMILRGMRDSTRRKIQSTERKGVSVRYGANEDLLVFYELMKLTAQRAGFALRSFKYFETEFRAFEKKGQAVLLLAEMQGQTLAAHIAYMFGEHAAFFHQASNTEIPRLNPNCLLVWRAIEWAKSGGCSTYDLWGIPDEIGNLLSAEEELPTDRTDGLWGAYRFKSGFSKNVVTYVASQDYVYSPVSYRLLRSRQLSQGTLERISARLDTRFGRSHETE